FVAPHGARHAGDEPDPLRPLRDRAEHAPGVRAVPVLGEPRVEVVRDRDELEPARFGLDRLVDEFTRAADLGHQLPTEVRHDDLLCAGWRFVPTGSLRRTCTGAGRARATGERRTVGYAVGPWPCTPRRSAAADQSIGRRPS